MRTSVTFRSRAFLALLVATTLAGAACAKKVPAAHETLSQAARKAEKSDAPARIVALAGFHAFLVEGDFAKAQGLFDRALKVDPSEPWAHFGMLSLARRDAQPRKILEAALNLAERAPSHPLSAYGARSALELSGTAPGYDDIIVDRAPKVLAQSTLPETAHLLRSALASIAAGRDDLAQRDLLFTEMGTATEYTAAGPLSALDVLGFDELTPPEKTGDLSGPFDGPLGKLPPRVVKFPDGRFSLAGETSRGDGFVLAVDATVESPGVYLLRTVSSAAHRAFVDGTKVSERRAFERFPSSVTSAPIVLPAGTHRIVTKMIKDDRAGTLTLSLHRADGKPSNVRFQASRGAAPATWGQSVARPKIVGSYPDAGHLYDALEKEAGAYLAAWVAVNDGFDRDPDGSQRLLAALGDTPLSAPFLALRANVWLADRGAPAKVSHGRASRDLEASLGQDPKSVQALLQRALLSLDDSRMEEARGLLNRAKALQTPPAPPVALLDARLSLALNIDAEVDRAAQEALVAEPGLCEALGLRHEIARRQDAISRVDAVLKQAARCPGALERAAQEARTRGKNDEAISLSAKLAAQDPTDILRVTTYSNLLITAKRYDEATRVLEALLQVWPRNASVHKRLADVHEFAGRKAQALALREAALKLDGNDLALWRTVTRAKTGGEPLAGYTFKADEAIARFEKNAGSGENAATAYVLDAATVRIHSDGSMLDRVHVIQKVLDQSGVQDAAEVNLPQGAQVLTLRTRKADGATLEPENIEGKDSISLPGVQVGDYVEYEYLLAHAPRAAVMPGATPATFFFQLANQPNAWTTYRVIAPKGSGLTVDARNGVQTAPVKTQGNEEIFHHEEHNVPPYIVEPNAPPSQEEILPLVTLGVGQRGSEGLLHYYGDVFYERGRISHEVEVFARGAVGDKTGADAVQALYEAVMTKLSGRDAGLGQTAAASVSQDRGSRLWLLKASLEAVGIRARLAAVRTFSANPNASMFPSESQFPYVALRAEPEGSDPIWLDPTVRFSPFGQLPEQALGEREAYLLPEPGRPLTRVKTPGPSKIFGRRVELNLTLDATGKLTGEGTEVYEGIEGAITSEQLKALSEDQRNQALQSALSRYFNGADLGDVTVTLVEKVGTPLTVKYAFTANRFARVDKGRMMLAPLTFPSMLGRRYVQLSARRTPLYIDNTERTRTKVTLQLPEGYALRGEAMVTDEKTKFGNYRRVEKVDGRTLTIDEELSIPMSRVPPPEYESFGGFAGEVDLIQTRDLVLESR